MASKSFPADIISEILLKLPVESLLRCKSVCKEWYSLISDQNFIITHYSLSSTNNTHYEHHRLVYNPFVQRNNLKVCPLYDVLFHKSANNNNVLLLENPSPHEFRIVGSCNGLLCVLAEDDNTLFVYNPSTRITREFPGSKQGGVSLCVSYGFGYDESARDYKVVKIGRCDQTSRYWGTMTMIYSLKAGTWKEIVRFPRANIFADGVFLNGALHWLARYDSSGLCHIVSLDLGKETYGEVLPPEYNEGFKRLSLGVLGEWLCVLCNYYKTRVGEVWVMKVYGAKESWTKLACIPHPTNPRDVFLDALCISKDGKVLLRYGPQLLVFDSKDGSSLEIENFDKTYEACSLVESLVSPFHPLGLAVNGDDEY